MNADGQQEIIYNFISDTVENCDQESSDDENVVHHKKMALSEGLSSIEK